MLSAIARWILKRLGFKIVGDYPHDIAKKIIVAAPHTSNWDFPIGILLRNAIKAEINFVGKKSLFIFPFGFILKAMGGVPVDRSKSTNFVESMVQLFDSREKFTLTIAPEGKRKKVDKLKTGFYYIAKDANVAIVLIKFDWGNKVLEWRQPFYPSGNIISDMELIDDFFRGVAGYNPEDGYLYNVSK